MNKTILTATGIAIVTSLLLLSTSSAQPASQPDVKSVADGNNAFALELYAALKDQPGNLFLSPYSISTALAMTYAGARGNTEAQMAKTLHFGLPQERLHPAFASLLHDVSTGEKKGCELATANALWGQKGDRFLPSFLDLTKTNYGAGLRQVDFRGATEEARKTINDWVEEQTRQKIKELLKPRVLNEATSLVLTNAIYCKGQWTEKFDKKMTRDGEFSVSADKKAQVPMMKRTGGYAYAKEDSVQVLELPYEGDELSMLIFLPDKVDGLAGFEQTLNADKLGNLMQTLTEIPVAVSLPRFTTTCEFELKKTLTAMGMTDAFVYRKAEALSGMDGTKELYISAVVHKAFADVNEEGTEAAAATAVVTKRAAMPMPTMFRADHPFLFLIRHKPTNSILFIGRMTNPSGNGQ